MERLDSPIPMRRRGPRPLLLHLGLAMLTSGASAGGLQNWNSAWRSWKSPEAAKTAEKLAEGLGPDLTARFPEAVLRELGRQNQGLIAGIAAYRRHPWQRELPEPPTIWSEGNIRLLDYGGTGPTVLFVPSLVNRAYVLDLAPGASMLRYLAGAGVRPLLLDWGWPGAVERQFTLTDYIAGPLERALAHAAAEGPVVLGGYCMGGLLALATAQRRPDLVRGLALLATPWDFHGDDPARAQSVASLLPLMEPMLAFNSTLPVDALQVLFAMLDPWSIARKYANFAKLDQNSARAQMFVALEDWLNDGVPLAAPVARETISGWYGANTPAHGAWRVAGAAVDPRLVQMPAFVAVPEADRIVLPESARPLAALLPNATLLTPHAGHIGMVAGSRAERALWQPFAAWCGECSI